MTGAPAFTDADGFVATDDPQVKVSRHVPHALCDVFGHQWHMFPHPMAMVFNPETGVHLFDTYHAVCRRCPVRCLVERKPEPVNTGNGCPLCGDLHCYGGACREDPPSAPLV